MSAPRPIRFVHRGEIRSVAGLPPATTVLQYLREHARCTGTKEGCAEGDCGACTVLVGELNADGETVALRNVNACIQFLPMLDGKALLTVEDLGSAVALHPVQEALVRCHGSQCGFCTPGFAMTMQALYERHQAEGTRPTRQSLADDLAGNLCRCTGYRPLLDAGERMFDAPARCLDRAPLVRGLRTLQADPPLHYEAPSRQGDLQRVHAPQTIEALAQLRLQLPEARLVAGATDVGLWVNKQHRELGDILLTGRVAEMRSIQALSAPAVLRIGAAATLEEAWAALTVHFGALRELWLRFASPPVRHAGTLGGNLANGSPIGDGAPALIALGATLVLRRGEDQRRLPLEAFYLDYMKNALAPGEFVEAVEVPLPDAEEDHAQRRDEAAWEPPQQYGPDGLDRPDGPERSDAHADAPGRLRHLRAYKVSKRYDSDISAVCAVFAVTLEGSRVVQARFVFGGMAAVVKRATAAEAAVLGRPWDAETPRVAAQALAQDFKPLTDLRASAGYRQRVAANLLQRFWLETRAQSPLERAQASVWTPSPAGTTARPAQGLPPAGVSLEGQP